MRSRLLIVALLLASPAHASSRATRSVSVSLTPAEKLLVEDARDDKLDRFDPVTAAIATSTASQDVKDRAQTHWMDFLTGLTSEALARPPRERAEWLLQAMHAQLLGGGYSFYQNDVAVLLDDGTFNCVTSAIVYHAIAQHFGLDVRGVLVPSHVYERVVVDGVDYDIETTSPHGFLLDRDDATYARFLAEMRLDQEKRSGHKIPPEKFYRREADALDLVAMLYANRGAQEVEEGKTPNAVADFARASLLASDERYARDSRDLLLGQMADQRILKGQLHDARELYAWAIRDPGGDPTIVARFKDNIGYCWGVEAKQKMDRKDWEAALAAWSAASKWSDEPIIAIDEAATYNQWGLQELDAKEYARAVSVFLRARNAFPDDPIFPQNLKAAYYDWANSQVKAKKGDDALATMKELRTRLPGDADAARGYASIAARVAELRSTAGDWEGAGAAMEDALAVDPTYPNLRPNVAATWTNAGVHFFQAGSPARAETAWKRALELDPGAGAARANLDRMHAASAAAAGSAASASASER